MSKPLTPEAAARARTLYDEIKKLTEQRFLVNQELISKLNKALEKVRAVPAPGGFAAAAAKSQQAAKRTSQPSGLGLPDAKRPKLDGEQDKKIQDIWRQCATVLDYLMKKKNAPIFTKPVDPVRDGVPDYFKFISHPMDLGTIKTKLRERKYNDVREFAADVRLVWSNCRTYNQAGTIVRQMGDGMSDDWEKKWAEQNIEQRWDDLVLSRDPQAISLDRRIASSARQLLQRVNSVHMLPDADPSRSMTSVEKRKLSIALSELQGDQLAEVLNIIAENLKDVNPDDEEEIELDVDQLDNTTLWRLREYCDAVANKLPHHGAAPTKQAPPAAHKAAAAGGAGAAAATGAVSRPAHDNGKQAAGGANKPPARTESGSESDRYSAEQDVKGSNMVEQPQSQPNFVKNTRTAIPVDESATAPKDKPAIATDRKSNKDVVLNASAWTAAEEDPVEGGGEGGEAAGGGAEEGDDLWDTFRSVAEREKQQKADEEKRRKELEAEREKERLRAVAEARQAKEEEERRMREAEEAAAAEAKRAKDEARQKELEELQMQANTAQVYQPPDAQFAATIASGGADMAELGLVYKHDDTDDVNFDD